MGVLKGEPLLLGGTSTGSHPVWIVEVAVDVDDVFDIFNNAGYLSFESSLISLQPVTASTITPGANALFIHRNDDRLEKVAPDRRAAVSRP